MSKGFRPKAYHLPPRRYFLAYFTMGTLSGHALGISAAEGVVEAKFVADHDEVTKGTQYDADVQFIANFPEHKRKEIVRKIDWRLPPFLALLYST